MYGIERFRAEYGPCDGVVVGDVGGGGEKGVEGCVGESTGCVGGNGRKGMSVNWAKERAHPIIRPLKTLIGHGLEPEEYDEIWDRISAELQRVANECVEVAEYAATRSNGEGMAMAKIVASSINFRFPSEE